MTNLSVAEQADRLSRRRAGMMIALALMLLIQQFAFFSEQAGDTRPVIFVHRGAWLVLTGVILGALVTGGFWWKPKAIRALAEDDVTRANRFRALSLGFVLAIVTAMALSVLDQFEPVGLQPAIHTIISVGMAAALVRFSMLERRALG